MTCVASQQGNKDPDLIHLNFSLPRVKVVWRGSCLHSEELLSSLVLDNMKDMLAGLLPHDPLAPQISTPSVQLCSASSLSGCPGTAGSGWNDQSELEWMRSVGSGSGGSESRSGRRGFPENFNETALLDDLNLCM